MTEPHEVPDELDPPHDTSYAPAETAVLGGLLDEAMGRDTDGATEPIQPFQAPPEKPDPDRYGAPGAVPDKPDDDGKQPNDGDLDVGDPPDEIVEEIVEAAK